MWRNWRRDLEADRSSTIDQASRSATNDLNNLLPFVACLTIFKCYFLLQILNDGKEITHVLKAGFVQPNNLIVI